MKIKFETRDIIIMALLLGIGIMFILRSCDNNSSSKPPVTDSISFINSLGDSVKAIRGTALAFATENIALRDSIAKITGISNKRIDFLTTANLQLKGIIESTEPATVITSPADPVVFDSSGKECPPVIHTLSKRLFNGLDTFDVVLSTTDTNRIRYSISSNMYNVGGWVKQKGWFKPKLFRNDLSFDNPNIHISGMKSWVSPPSKPKRFNISIGGGYGYFLGSELKRGGFVGITTGYSLIRF